MESSLVFLVFLVTTCAAQTTLPGVTGCGADSYYDPFGAISSPNYPSNYDNMLDCDYNVYASAESSLAIIFNSFHVETVDVVTISCPTNASFPPQEYTGHALPEPVSIPWCSQGLVNFRTDASVVSTGFTLDYYASVGGCGQTLYTGENGFVNSPGWESPYDYNQNCFNIIYAQEQSTIHLHFRYFDLENCSSCNCDWLEIRCLDNSESGPVKYCGNHDNHMLYVYRCSQLLLWFHSDENNNYPGFHIEYNVYSDAGCGPPYYYPPSGVISSPNYPGEYYSNLDCNYDVQASPGSTISFIFKAFNTEECCDRVNISCQTNSSFTSQSFGGQSIPPPVSVPWCSLGRVNFRSDYSIFDTGFTLDYFVSFGGCGNTLYGGSHGYVTSPSYPSYYGNDQNCTNIIWAEQPSHFHLQFLFIDVPFCGSCICDWVEISCLDNNPSDKHRYCGDIENSLDFYQCTQVLVWFTSDSSDVYPGFNLEYNIIAENSTETTGVPDTTKLPQTTYPLPVTTFPPEITTVPDTTKLPQTTHPAPIRTIPEEVTTVAATTITTNKVQSTAQETTFAETMAATMAATTVNMETTAQEIAVTTSVASTTKFQTTFPPAATTIEQGTTSMAGTTVFEQTTFSQAIITSEPACGETSYYGPTGVISSPNYPLLYDRNLDCNYYVYGSTGSSISFIFKSFDTEEYQDFVTISCPTNSSFTAKSFSGQSLPNPVSIPWCSLGLVNFHSDDSVVATGFMLNYYVSDGGCGNTVYNESHGFVTSPNWPSEYGIDHSCLNIIWAPQRSTIYIDFLEFFLHSCCSCDWLEISCLDNSEFGPYKYCGSYSYDSLSIYQCRQALLWFRSDSSLVNQGFNIEYNVYLNGESTGVPGITTPTPPGSCGSLNYNGPSGTIISPNYPGNYFPSLKCQYYIIASTGSSIAIIFEHFDVQVDKDYLTISCETNTSFPEQRYSGNTLPPPISIPWCSQGSLYFYTDAITEYSGFSLDYHVSEGGCGETTYSGSFGYVTSPNYPSNYGDNHDCYNVISAPERSHFYLRYLAFNVQFSEPCSLDWVEISCLDNNPSNKHRFCGSTDTVYSLDFYQCSEVLVWFHSDGATVFEGFNLEYNVYPDTGCGETSYYGPSGNISSPKYPDFYNNSLYCDYDIYTSSPDDSIAIIFKAFNTEQCCDFVTVSCPTNSSYSPVTYSGHSIPPAVSIPWCSQGRVNFGSDIAIVFPGFSLDYHTSLGGCGNTVYTETNGYVSSPNYPSPYGNNQDCSNIIWAPKPTAFTINFLAMDTEGCCDYVELSCVDNPGYAKQRFDGNVIPPPQSIPLCTQILVRFVSDGSTALVGFNLEYLVSMGSESDILS